MVKIKYFLILLLLLVISCEKKVTESESIKETYNNYKSAILNDRGEKAANYVDSTTIKYYSDILEKVKNADETTLNSLSILDKLQVLLIRQRATKEEIQSFDGKKLIVFTINNGFVGKNGASNQSIGEITSEGNFAKGQIIVKGQKTSLYWHFNKEENQWKIDLTSIFPMTILAFRKMQEDSGMAENEYIFQLIEAVSNRKVDENVWIPTEKLNP